MRFIKSNDECVDDLVVIGNWAKSCMTREQLTTVEKFLEKYVDKYSYCKFGADRVLFNQGMVFGIILTIKKLRFGKTK